MQVEHWAIHIKQDKEALFQFQTWLHVDSSERAVSSHTGIFFSHCYLYTCTSLMTNWLNQMSISTLTTFVPITNYHTNGLSDVNYKVRSTLQNGYYLSES